MKRRSGFTLIELLVVIVILLVLATLTYAVFRTGTGSDRMRSGARIVQSAFLGAKDRALHAKDLRGIRFSRDLNNSLLVNGFVYLQPLPLQTAQGITIDRPGLQNNPPNTDATDLVIPGQQGASFYAQDQAGIWPYLSVQVRIVWNVSYKFFKVNEDDEEFHQQVTVWLRDAREDDLDQAARAFVGR